MQRQLEDIKMQLCCIFAFMASYFSTTVEIDPTPDTMLKSTLLSTDTTWTIPVEHEAEYSTESSGIKATTELHDFSSHDPCSSSGSCGFTANLRLPYTRFCHCDSDCVIYGDCCHDSNFKMDESKKDKRYDCHPNIFSDKLRHIGAFVIDKCHSSYLETEIETKCLQNLSLSGPFVSDEKGVVFKNRFCAECNFVTNVTFFNLWLFNLEKDQGNTYNNLENLLALPDTHYKMIEPDGILLRSCVVLDIPDGNGHTCDMYNINPKLFKREHTEPTMLYRNYLCQVEGDIVYEKCYGAFIKYIQVTYSPHALSAMFSFSCWNKDEICHPEPTIMNDTSVVYLRFDSELQITPSMIEAVIKSTIAIPEKIDINKGTATTNVTNPGQLTPFTYYISLTLSFQPLSATKLANLKDQIQNFSGKIYVRVSESNDQITIHVVSLREESTNDYPIIWTYPENDPMTILHNTNKLDEFCPNIFMNCSILDNNFIIEHIRCIASTKQDKGVDAKVIITYVGCSLSVVALIVSILFSRKLNICNSIPGNNFENMSVSLCISNLCFMLGVGMNDVQILCYLAGILLHYCWLCSFSFMSIAIVFLCRQVTSMTISTSTTDRTKWLLSATGFCLPILFVVPSVLLDYFDVPNWHAVYAGDSVCFPTGRLINLVFVTCPIMLSILINFLFFVLIIFHLLMHKKDMDIIRKSANTQHAKIYLRVCSFTGIFWICGIFGAFVRSDVVEYIFIVLCSLQGLGVAIANLTTKKVVSGLRGFHPTFSFYTSKSSFAKSEFKTSDSKSDFKRSESNSSD